MTTKTKTKPRKTTKTKAKVKPTTTLLSFILDESGSMETVKDATISGFNEYLNTMKKQKNEVLFTLTKFNSTKVELAYAAAAIKTVPELTAKTYRPDNGTPLYDAIGKTITSIDQELKNWAKKPAVLVTIMTDGEENSSKEYNLASIKALIEARTKDGWTFSYLGANQNAWTVGASFGVGIGNSMTYDQTVTRGVFTGVVNAHVSYLSSGSKQTESLLSAKNLGVDADEYKTLTGGATPKSKP